MAFYVFEFNVPKATLEASPVRLEREVTARVLKQISIGIPQGHQGLARIRVETREKPIIPTAGSVPMWIRGDGNTISVAPNEALPGPEWRLTFLGWNEDPLYDHAFIISMDVQNQ
jgi:hypothetical protein